MRSHVITNQLKNTFLTFNIDNPETDNIKALRE